MSDTGGKRGRPPRETKLRGELLTALARYMSMPGDESEACFDELASVCAQCLSPESIVDRRVMASAVRLAEAEWIEVRGVEDKTIVLRSLARATARFAIEMDLFDDRDASMEAVTDRFRKATAESTGKK